MLAEIFEGERDWADIFFLLAAIAGAVSAFSFGRPVTTTGTAARIPVGSVLLGVAVALIAIGLMAL